MNLALSARDVLTGLSPKLVDQLDQLIGRINFVWNKGHNPQHGGHRNLIFQSDAEQTIQTQLTVGAAGAASALPATPSLYLVLTIEGVEYVVPVYAQS